MTSDGDNNFWTDDRLNQLASLTAANADGLAETRSSIEALREQQQTTTANIESLREQQESTNTNIDTLTGFINGHQVHITTLLQEIRDIKVDIRGLQLENRRMLEELRGRRVMSKYAEHTTVDSDRSIAEVRKILARYGASKFICGHDYESLQAVIAFTMRGRNIKFVIPLPNPKAREFTRTPAKQLPRTPEAALEAYEQAIRQRFRAMALLVKAKLEAIDAGIATFESELLNKTLLPNGMTVEEYVEPQVQQAYLDGKMPPLLIAGS